MMISALRAERCAAVTTATATTASTTATIVVESVVVCVADFADGGNKNKQ